jgi:hypothetical protein
MPALVALHFNPASHAFADRLRAAVMRKLLHLVLGVLKVGQPFDPNWLAAS